MIEAIRLDPKPTRLFPSRGELWRQKGDLVRALKDIDHSIKLNPERRLGHLYRGDTLRYKGDFAGGAGRLRVIAEAYAAGHCGLTSVGLTYEKMGDLARARDAFKKAVDLEIGGPRQHQQFEPGNRPRPPRRTRFRRPAAGHSGSPLESRLRDIDPDARGHRTAVAADTAAQQGRRIALVIGNSAYKNVPALPNPKRDAEAIAASLRAVGFEEVTLVSDSDRGRLLDTLKTFANNAEKADWAVVYYAGHGMEVSGVNYLIPIEAKVAVDRDVQYEAVPLDQVMTAVEGAKKLRLVLLDACRDNPFASQMQKTAAVQPLSSAAKGSGGTRTRSVSRGLSEVKVSGATLVVYAAKHGQTALDGEGGNSPFAVAFAQRIATPNVEINKLFRLVRDDVMEATAGRQEPYTYGSLPGREDFFFLAK